MLIIKILNAIRNRVKTVGSKKLKVEVRMVLTGLGL